MADAEISFHVRARFIDTREVYDTSIVNVQSAGSVQPDAELACVCVHGRTSSAHRHRSRCSHVLTQFDFTTALTRGVQVVVNTTIKDINVTNAAVLLTHDHMHVPIFAGLLDHVEGRAHAIHGDGSRRGRLVFGATEHIPPVVIHGSAIGDVHRAGSSTVPELGIGTIARWSGSNMPDGLRSRNIHCRGSVIAPRFAPSLRFERALGDIHGPIRDRRGSPVSGEELARYDAVCGVLKRDVECSRSPIHSSAEGIQHSTCSVSGNRRSCGVSVCDVHHTGGTIVTDFDVCSRIDRSSVEIVSSVASGIHT